MEFGHALQRRHLEKYVLNKSSTVMVLCMRGMGATDFGPILHVSQRPTLTLSVNNCLHNNFLHQSNHDQNEVNEYGILIEPSQIFLKLSFIVCVYTSIWRI